MLNSSRGLLTGAAAVLVSFILIGGAHAREHIHIVGSSTVYPFATVVAEKFGRATAFRTPIIEATGSGGGLKLFCAGVGVSHPDFANSSRRMKPSEFRQCAANGVTDIVEIKIGYDGIVFANSADAPPMTIARRDIFLGLAKQVPNPNGDESFVANPYQQWNEVNADLPAVKIQVLGPPPTSGTRDAFVELAMEGGCKTFPFIQSLKKTDPDHYKSICHQMREDGHFVEAGENDNLIVQKLRQNAAAFGIFGFSFLDQNFDVVQGANIDGVAAEFENIADRAYPISRPLYIYAKTAHIGMIPGMAKFMDELSAESTWGEDGYLTDRGLIPMPAAERAAFRAAIQRREKLAL